MTFNEYLKSIGKKPSVWAREHGMSVSTVWRAYKEKGRPTLETVENIRLESGGKVNGEDWMRGES